MKPLKLSGRAFPRGLVGRRVLRLVDPSSQPTVNDAVIIKTKADLANARRNAHKLAVYLEEWPGLESSFSATLQLDREFDHLSPGDVIAVGDRATNVRVLYRANSKHNSFLVTERCNHWCLMCSQPPRAADDDYLLAEISEAIDLLPASVPAITFTGGEPLTNLRPFIGLLEKMRDKLPNTLVHVLTNGRRFADTSAVRAWASVKHPNLMAGIPLYSSVDHVHDHIVQSAGAFEETVVGIMKLKDAGQRVEVRIVLHGLTVPRLEKTCQWISRNLPFVDHIALMGMEHTGFAIANSRELWVDPQDYRLPLKAALEILQSARIRSSIYNLPLCLLDRACWPAAVQSISDWKNAYLPQCETCAVRNNCAGFFSSGRPKHSASVQPIIMPV